MSQNQSAGLITSTGVNQTKVIANKTVAAQPGASVRVGNAVNLATIAGKPMILASGTKTQGQHQVKTPIFCLRIFLRIRPRFFWQTWRPKNCLIFFFLFLECDIDVAKRGR